MNPQEVLVALIATNRVHQCVFSPSHTGYMAARPGTPLTDLRAMLDHPTRRAPPHRSCGVSGARGGPSWPYFFRRPRWWSAYFVWRYGHIGRLSVSPIQIVWGFHRTFKYCKTFVLFQKLTGGGDSTLVMYCTYTTRVEYWDADGIYGSLP